MSHSHEAGEAHGHDHTAGANSRMLTWALVLTSLFLVAEVIAGIAYNSLALLSDAAHMMTDVAALAIALLAIKVGNRPADNRRTFGYKRLEILAAAFNAILLFVVAIYVFVEAIGRFRNPEPTESTGMLIVAVLGLIVNLVSMRLLASGRDASFNVKGAYLEVWADMLGSVGVIAGALAIKFTGWPWVDPLVAVAIGLWVLPRTWILLRDTTNVLLEGVPSGMNLGDIRKAIKEVPGIVDVHDLHVWATSNDQVSFTAHISVAGGRDQGEVRKAVEAMLRERFEIVHSTIQVEGQGEEHVGHEFHP